MIHYMQPSRVQYGADDDGVMMRAKREDEIVPLVIDWADTLGELGSSVTISSVAYSDSGITRSSTSNTTTTTTTYVTGIGETEITLTLSDGGKVQRLVRFRSEESSDAGRVHDYD